MRFADWIFGTVLAVIGVAIVAEAQTFPGIPGQLYGAGFFPTIVGSGLAVVGLALAVSGIRRHQAAVSVDGWVRSPPNLLRVATPIVCIVALLLGMEELGFLLMAFAAAFALQVVLGVRLVTAGVVSIAGPLAIHYIFASLLRVPLPPGYVESLLR